MNAITAWMDRTLYAQFDNNWDNKLLRITLLKHVTEQSTVLDIGAGAGFVREVNIKGLVHRVCGLDPDQVVLSNPLLDEAKVGSAESIPWPDNTFDLVFANNVLEHLENPATAFSEIARVLKPGGLFVSKTPNRWHYVALLSCVTPHSIHRLINRMRGRSEEHTFPTFYRANSRSCFEQLASRSGLIVQDIAMIEGRPEYLRLFPALYVLGWAYERAVNHLQCLSRFRVVLLATLRKPILQ